MRNCSTRRNFARPAGITAEASRDPTRERDGDAGLLGVVDRLIAGLAPTWDLSLVRVAERLGLSPRGLQRRTSVASLARARNGYGVGAAVGA